MKLLRPIVIPWKDEQILKVNIAPDACPRRAPSEALFFDRIDGRLSQPFTNEDGKKSLNPRARTLVPDDRADR
jgi:hypothetical protein